VVEEEKELEELGKVKSNSKLFYEEHLIWRENI